MHCFFSSILLLLSALSFFFFFNDTATTEIYTLSLHDALPILAICRGIQILNVALGGTLYQDLTSERPGPVDHADTRSRHGLRIESGTLLHRTLGAVDAKV